MKTSANIKPVASLSSTLLARKGEAMPAVASTIYNNPGLAWDEKEIRHTKRIDTKRTDIKRTDTTRAPSVLTTRTHKTKMPVKKMTIKPAPAPVKQKGDSIALIFNIEDEHYMRLKYQAQVSGKTSKELIRKAIEHYLDAEGTPVGSDWVVKPAK